MTALYFPYSKNRIYLHIASKTLLGAIFLLLINNVQGQQSEVFKKDGTTLIFSNSDPDFNEEVKTGLIETFFHVLPNLSSTFNPEVITTMELMIDTSYTGVAYASNGKITISSNWLKENPKDLDVITHEVMHIVQNYPPNSAPGWLTEGIADYARYMYGVDNEGAQWYLPDFSPEHSYKNSYRITARFLLWISKNYNQEIVISLDDKIRKNSYSSILWEDLTGKSLDELWESYSKNPHKI